MSTLTLSDSQVRIVVDPNPLEAPNFAEKHISFQIGSPEPFSPSGAGRYAYKANRNLILFVYTESLLDVAGSDEAGLQRHLDFEDNIIDKLVDAGRPLAVGEEPDTKIGTRGIRFIGGNGAPQRPSKKDSALLVSTLNFQVEYVLRTQVTRQVS